MKRDQGYFRKQRKRAIHRKEGILRRIGGDAYVYAWSRGKSGRFAKGKIHCSCWMCRTKSYDSLSCRDQRIALAAKDQIRELECNIKHAKHLLP